MASQPAPGGGRWRDLGLRAASALVLLPVVLACFWWGGWPWAALLLLALALLCWEWGGLTGQSVLAWPGMLLADAVLGAAVLTLVGMPALGLLLLVIGLLVCLALTRRGWFASGALYIGLTGPALWLLRDDPAHGLGNLLFLFLVVWASDVGAYLAGRLLGGPKLAPAISPNKTWAGALGGLAAAALIGLLASLLLGAGGSPITGLVVAAGLGIASQIGDLFESWIKRRFGVKDSSALIPGHGGLLDRVDGVLAAAPVAALLWSAQGQGGFLWQ